MFDDKELGVLDFRSLGNALYPELEKGFERRSLYFRSLGNALYPELHAQVARRSADFRSLGNALYLEHKNRLINIRKILDRLENALQQKQQQIYTKIYLLPIICFCSFPQ